MAKWYTAEDMRKMANREKFKCSFVTRTLNGGIILDCTSDVRAMLRQAADEMEREKKYEYGVRFDENKIDCDRDYIVESKEYARKIAGDSLQVVRRAVGEWEEVPND